jgi:hypothetical protein
MQFDLVTYARARSAHATPCTRRSTDVGAGTSGVSIAAGKAANTAGGRLFIKNISQSL